MEKDFTTISPSAVSLLLLKALTDIPFAKQAALAMFGDDAVRQAVENIQNNTAQIMRLLHFEDRYKTVDEALQKCGIANIIEISAGFSFRGLRMCTDGILLEGCHPSGRSMFADKHVHYLDTDLPSIVSMKTGLINNFVNQWPANYTVAPLNVLDKEAFKQVAAQLPTGPVAIVNEGLLVYLNTDEKRKLCAIIHSILQERGGCWITADIYVRTAVKIGRQDGTQNFLDTHNVEENKFEDYASADEFFTGCGFRIIDKFIKPAQPLSARKYLNMENITPMAEKGAKHIRETWVLQPN